jgi:hypothetical protein
MAAQRTQTTTRLEDGTFAAPLRPPSARGVSIRPAMVVLALALLILGLFVTLGVVTSTRVAPVHPVSRGKVPGTPLRAMSAAAALAPIVADGQPPTDVLNAVFLPVGSVRLSSADDSASAGQYDQEVTLRSSASQGALLGFFAADMRLQGWQVFDRGPASHDPGALEVLGKIAGSDGYYWEMGATVSATTFGAGAPPGGWTDFSVRLFQIDDQS